MRFRVRNVPVPCRRNCAPISFTTSSLLRKQKLAQCSGMNGFPARELFAYGIRIHAVGRGLGRFQNTGATVPADLSRAVLFLCSPRASHLTGHIVNLP